MTKVRWGLLLDTGISMDRFRQNKSAQFSRHIIIMFVNIVFAKYVVL